MVPPHVAQPQVGLVVPSLQTILLPEHLDETPPWLEQQPEQAAGAKLIGGAPAFAAFPLISENQSPAKTGMQLDATRAITVRKERIAFLVMAWLRGARSELSANSHP